MEPEAVEALRILARVCCQEGRRFALIGATVPQVVLDFRGSSGSGSRETRDVDAVAEVNSWDDFTRLCERLGQDGFRQGQVAHELWFGDQMRIDLIPFGPSLVEHDKLSWPYGDSVMTACGLEEALECARDQQVAPDLTLPVVSIPGLILMKVVAYMDRPAERARDLSDVLYCFEHYEQTAGESRRFDYAGKAVQWRTRRLPMRKRALSCSVSKSRPWLNRVPAILYGAFSMGCQTNSHRQFLKIFQKRSASSIATIGAACYIGFSVFLALG